MNRHQASQGRFPVAYRVQLDFEPRCCGLCRHARLSSSAPEASGTCARPRYGRVDGAREKPLVIAPNFGTCCEHFVRDQCITERGAA